MVPRVLLGGAPNAVSTTFNRFNARFCMSLLDVTEITSNSPANGIRDPGSGVVSAWEFGLQGKSGPWRIDSWCCLWSFWSWGSILL